MRMIVCAFALLALSAGAAAAQEAANATSAARDAVDRPQAQKAQKVVYICDNSAMTRRAFAREFGAVQFVSAETAAAKGETWSAPRCITQGEAQRLRGKQLASTR